jgi:hypothetical protein
MVALIGEAVIILVRGRPGLAHAGLLGGAGGSRGITGFTGESSESEGTGEQECEPG